MSAENSNEKPLTRRRLLPLLLGGMLLPFAGSGKELQVGENKAGEDADGYQTFLREDGTTVRVKVQSLKGARVIKKNVSNKSLLSWLRKTK